MDQQSRPTPLMIKVSFETTRLSAQCLIEAYDRLVPNRRRRIRPLRELEPGEGDALTMRRSDHA
jgi:hypothetical protein